jgi:hypothetical protein
VAKEIVIPKLVEVLWEDFTVFHGWRDHEEIVDIVDGECDKCLSVGYLVADKPDKIVIAPTIALGEALTKEMADLIRIPRSQAKSIRNLRYENSRTRNT